MSPVKSELLPPGDEKIEQLRIADVYYQEAIRLNPKVMETLCSYYIMSINNRC